MPSNASPVSHAHQRSMIVELKVDDLGRLPLVDSHTHMHSQVANIQMEASRRACVGVGDEEESAAAAEQAIKKPSG